MTQFRTIPRQPTQRARARRMANAFLTYGGEGGGNITHHFTNREYGVTAQEGVGTAPIIEALDTNGNVVLAIDGIGLSSPERNISVINTNTTLANSQVNQIISLDPGANTTITLPASSSLQAGAWIGFQDVSGTATINTISIDPNFSSSGYELDGGNTSVLLVTVNNGLGYVRLLKDSAGDSNWFSDKAEDTATSGGLSQIGSIFSTTSNTTIGTGVQCLLVDTSSGNRKITLPFAPAYNRVILHIKKITADVNQLIIASTGAVKIDGSTNNISSTVGKAAFSLLSNGTDWFILSELDTLIVP